MKKYLLIGTFIAVLAIPSVTMAAWYNPLSWFKKAPVTVVVPAQTDVSADTSVAPIAAPVALPAPKPLFSNNITVADPKIQGQINTLLQENTTLQTQLASLTASYNTLVSQNTALIAQVATTNASLKTAQDSYTALDTEKADARAKATADKAAADELSTEIKSNCTDPISSIVAQEAQIESDYQTAVTNLNTSNANSGATDAGVAPQYSALQKAKNVKISALDAQMSQLYATCEAKYNL